MYFSTQIYFMKHIYLLFFLLIALVITSCNSKDNADVAVPEKVFDWSSAHVYFLLTDRFKNGDTTNDTIINRDLETGKLRDFRGGDFAGIIQKLDEGYFSDLGVNAIWLTPIWEQIHGSVDEGTGNTYAFHGYWAKDWTAIEPSYGTYEEFKTIVQKAHDQDIRVLLDVVINHTGPVTELDPVWPSDWVRTTPTCTYQDQATAVDCTLTNNLPDILTNSSKEVELPEILIQKWKKEGRYEQEIQEIDAFFEETGLPRTPSNYLIKWVTDYARETGVDGFRVDTVKHVEEDVWQTFIDQSKKAFEKWKSNHPDLMIHDDEFFVLGELYGWEVAGGRPFPYSDENQVDYFDYGYDGMINFGFKRHAQASYEELFSKYDSFRESLLNEDPNDKAYFMNYISSHDDGQPFDPRREKRYEAATKLLLAPGMAQTYYGDETARQLIVDGALGDANLRSMMNWNAIDNNLLSHYQKLGTFRSNHPAVGAGKHFKLEHDGQGVLFARFYNKNGVVDDVLVGTGLTNGPTTIEVKKVFPNATEIRDAYSDKILSVEDGMVSIQVVNNTILLESF